VVENFEAEAAASNEPTTASRVRSYKTPEARRVEGRAEANAIRSPPTGTTSREWSFRTQDTVGGEAGSGHEVRARKRPDGTLTYMEQNRQGFDAWEKRRIRRNKRRHLIETAANLVALQAMLVTLFAQTWRGFLSGRTWSEPASWTILAVAGVVNLSLIIWPERGLAWVVAGNKAVGRITLGSVSALILAVLYIVTIPIGTTLGKRRYGLTHPQGAAWVDAKRDWRKSSWVKKTSEADRSVHQRGTLARMTGYFLERGNIVALIIIAVLLLAVSLSMLAHTPYLAPFVYTIF